MVHFTGLGRGVATAAVLLATVSAGAMTAMAGGFQIKEQSALGQGSSFAGFGAQDSISAMGVNPAAVTSQDGLNTYSNITAILPTANMTAEPGTTVAGSTALANAFSRSADIGRDAYVPASYGSYQFKGYDPRLFVGVAITSQFGLATEPDKRWVGSPVGDSTKLFTTNVNPVLGYKFSDQLSVAAGPAFEYAHGVLKFATGTPTGANTYFDGDDFAVGVTAGLMYKPAPGTSIGLSWRSAITHELEGNFGTNYKTGNSVLDARLGAGVAAKTEVRLPDVINISLKQAVSPNINLLGTVEWTNWSRFNNLTLTSQGPGYTVINGPFVSYPSGTQLGVISAKWDDGWFFSGGAEYMVSPQLTLRAGGAYEISPIRSATERVVSIPDADRIWASVGFSYNISNTMTVDFGYSHLWVDNAQIDRTSLGTPSSHLLASLDADIDIISLGLRIKLGN